MKSATRRWPHGYPLRQHAIMEGLIKVLDCIGESVDGMKIAVEVSVCVGKKVLCTVGPKPAECG